MCFPSQKGILVILLAIFLVVCIPVITNLISDDVKTWCLNTFGEGYTRYLYVPFVVGCVAMLFLTTDVAKWLKSGSVLSATHRYNIPPGPKSKKVLDQAIVEIGKGKLGDALRQLSDLKSPTLSAQISLLGSQLANLQRTSQRGTIDFNTESRAFQRIASSTRDLITALEAELNVSSANDDTIREYLKKRYTNRLEQKLAKRQPVNLRRLVNKDVVPEDFHAAFVSYSSDEVSGAMLQTFHEAQGRLLLVGAPGAGKTVLMLQLVLELLDSEPDALPVLLNLATWSKEFITLEAWLKKILPAETGARERYAAEMLQQNNLILLFDGFDEIREEDRLSCLEAINRYSTDGRPYVISSRKQEFKDVKKGVLVHLPVEVCPLSFDQLKTELLRLRNDPDQPERGATLLLDALEKYPLLQEAVKIPFYFNALQTLFNEGVGLSEMRFKAVTIEGRQTEIKERFIEHGTKDHLQYTSKDIRRWLTFLSSRMTSRNMVVFELRDLQYDWMGQKRPNTHVLVAHIIDSFIKLLIVGLIVGLIFGPIFGLIAVLFCVLISVLIIGLLIGLLGQLGSVLFLLLIFEMFSMLFGGLFNRMFYGLSSGVIAWIFVEMIGVNGGELFGGLGGVKGGAMPSIITKDSLIWPKKFIKPALINMVTVGLVGLVIGVLTAVFYGGPVSVLTGGLLFGLLFGLFAGLVKVGGLFDNYSNILQITSPYHRFNASKKAFHFSIIQHKHLCSLLRKRNLLPPDLPQFLNEMSLRHIMEFDGDPKTGTGGGSWRFRHRILQEYFAERWVEEEDAGGIIKSGQE